MPWLEEGLKEGQASYVSHVVAWWVLQHTHKTLRADAGGQAERGKRSRQSVSASR